MASEKVAVAGRRPFDARKVVALWLDHIQRECGGAWPHPVPEATTTGIANALALKRETVDRVVTEQPRSERWFEKFRAGKPGYYQNATTARQWVKNELELRRFSLNGEERLTLAEIKQRLLPDDPDVTVAHVALRIDANNRYQAATPRTPSPRPPGQHSPMTEMTGAGSPGLLHAMRLLGVEEATVQLSKSGLEPTECMTRTKKTLRFMGVFGSKWVQRSHDLALLENTLARLGREGGGAEFLLLDPDSLAFEELRRKREGHISATALTNFAKLQTKYPCLQVRLYSHMPHFRLVFIDGEFVAVARYPSDRQQYISGDYGWHAPHLVVRPGTPWSLYEGFNLYYADSWDKARRIRRGPR